MDSGPATWLHIYILDYLRKKKMVRSAETFCAEAGLDMSNTATQVPGLWEWWLQMWEARVASRAQPAGDMVLRAQQPEVSAPLVSVPRAPLHRPSLVLVGAENGLRWRLKSCRPVPGRRDAPRLGLAKGSRRGRGCGGRARVVGRGLSRTTPKDRSFCRALTSRPMQPLPPDALPRGFGPPRRGRRCARGRGVGAARSILGRAPALGR
eukprot:evm.model.scf_2469EXC.2 EVM.evm.TU.scf_2469EXC.2   scf_2469EXC:13353-14240(-)